MTSSSVRFAAVRARNCSTLRDARDVVRGEPSPGKRLLVHLDRRAIDLDRAQDGLQRQRDRALLVGEAEHEGVGGDAVAHQRRGDAGGVENVEIALADGLAEGRLHRALFEIDVGVLDKTRGRLQVGIDESPRDAALDAGERAGAGCDHDIAAEEQIGTAGGDAHGGDVFRPWARYAHGS